MITPELLQKCEIAPRPWGQVWWSQVLRLNFWIPPKITVIIEGMENIPIDRPVCFAMNHTDRYNCWPFLLHFLQQRNKFAVSWVKAKYYQNFFTRTFLSATSNIPLASRGYIIGKQFKDSVGRTPSRDEYRFIRDLLDQKQEVNQDSLLSASSECRQFLSPSPSKILQEIEDYFALLSKEVLELNRKAIKLGHNILVFPQGTRSKRLLKGHVGMAQMTQALGLDIIPIASMGSEVCYPGASPLAKGGTIRYRVGEIIPIDGEKLGQYRCETTFIPFSRSAEQEFGGKFRHITDIVMNEINELLDEPYQFASDTHNPSPSQTDVKRFL